MFQKEYIGFLAKFFKPKSALKIVCDASDGSVGPILKNLELRNLKLITINSKPNGRFPAHGPDPSSEKTSRALSLAVKKHKADFGAIFDGDGDRVFFVDNNGARVNPDAAAQLISKNFKPPFVTVMTSGWGFRKVFPAKYIRVSRVGHYYIKQAMRQNRAKFGAEHSGHFYFEFNFGDHRAYYDSALAALIEMANQVSALKSYGQPLSGWLKSLPQYLSSGELNFKVKDPVAKILKVKKAYAGKGKISTLDGITVEAKDFWFNLRPSNTEPLARLNAEAKNKKLLQNLLGDLRNILK